MITVTSLKAKPQTLQTSLCSSRTRAARPALPTHHQTLELPLLPWPSAGKREQVKNMNEEISQKHLTATQHKKWKRDRHSRGHGWASGDKQNPHRRTSNSGCNGAWEQVLRLRTLAGMAHLTRLPKARLNIRQKNTPRMEHNTVSPCEDCEPLASTGIYACSGGGRRGQPCATGPVLG